jgi:hypothetical protein
VAACAVAATVSCNSGEHAETQRGEINVVSVGTLQAKEPAAALKAAGVKASSAHSERFAARHALDGEPKTRWASDASSGVEFLQVDFGEILPVDTITIVWETAFARGYEIQVSDNGADWKVIAAITDGKGGKVEHKDLKGRGRYVRISCNKTAPPYKHYSIYEVTFGDGRLAEIRQEIQEALTRDKEQFRKKAVKSLKDKHGSTKVIFAARPLINKQHAYETFGRYSLDYQGGVIKVSAAKLCCLDLATGAVSVILDDPKGAIRDPAVHYDGETIVFSYRKGDSLRYHLYTIKSDGSELTQLTRGDFDDVEPCWLPNDDIIFASGRAQRWVPCFITESGNLFRVDAKGGNLRRVTMHVDHDLRPWVLPDGRICFTRWDYIDRQTMGTFHLWAANPDGANLQALKLSHDMEGWIDVKPVDAQHLVGIMGNKQHREHMGVPVLIDLGAGPEEPPRPRNYDWHTKAPGRTNSPNEVPVAGVRDLRGCGKFFFNYGAPCFYWSELNRDPCPINDRWFLVCASDGLYLVDDKEGRHEKILANDRLAIHEPVLLAPRDREPVIPDKVDPKSDTAQLIMLDFFAGRPKSIKGIKREEVDRILVVESLPAPIRTTNDPLQFGYGSIWNIKRQLGTFPVEKDGSAHVRIPAARTIHFIALDKQGRGLQRMAASFTMMPGETFACVGCHENRNTAPLSKRSVPIAASRPPSRLDLEGMTEFIDYMRDVQPIWDRHCVKCHNADDMKGRISLAGDLGLSHPHSMATLVGLEHLSLVSCALATKGYSPKEVSSFKSPLLDKLGGSHHKAKLTGKEKQLLIRWIEIGGPYQTLAASDGTGFFCLNPSRIPGRKAIKPAIRTKIKTTMKKRCSRCHTGGGGITALLGKHKRVALKQAKPRRITAGAVAGNFLFNLTHPEKSLLFRAPLAKEAGGLGYCQDKTGKAVDVFASTDDPDYVALLASVRDVRKEMNALDLPGFKPNKSYFDQMKRFGLLDEDASTDLDREALRELDERYYQQQYRIFLNQETMPAVSPKATEKSTGPIPSI